MVTYNSDTACKADYILLSINIAYVWSLCSGGARDAITSYYYE